MSRRISRTFFPTALLVLACAAGCAGGSGDSTGGASRRADLCRLHELELASAARRDRYEQLRDEHRALVKEHERIKAELESQHRELTRAERLLGEAEQRVAAVESGSLVREWEARALELERKLCEAELLRAAAESSAADLQARLRDTTLSEEQARRRAAELVAENQALEGELTRDARVALEEGALATAALGGKRVLYLGGRVSLVPHYRRLVERYGGEFLHHDGGLEESLDGVTRALGTVDVVFCPVDCISHAACLLAKKACRNLAKRFVPLRSAGLSSLVWAIVSGEEAVPPGSDGAAACARGAA